MARKKINQDGSESTITNYDEESENEASLAPNNPPEAADATKLESRPPIEVPASKKYIVLADRFVSVPNGRTLIKAGKVLDERYYNIASLQSQGLQFKLL